MKTEKQIKLKAIEAARDILGAMSNCDIIETNSRELQKIKEWVFAARPEFCAPFISEGIIVDHVLESEYTLRFTFECKMNESDFELSVATISSRDDDDLMVWHFTTGVSCEYGKQITMEDMHICGFNSPRVAVCQKQSYRQAELDRIIIDEIEKNEALMELSVSSVLAIFAYVNDLMLNPDKKVVEEVSVESGSIVQEDKPKEMRIDHDAVDAKDKPGTDYYKTVRRINLNGLTFVSKQKRTVRLIRSKKREYIASSWGVRGHYRRLKSGKTVFVKPYEKGKDRGKRLQKIYTISTEE